MRLVSEAERLKRSRDARWGSVTLEQRFWAKVRKGPGCWEWVAYVSNGYGVFSVGKRDASSNRHTEQAHRVSYELHFGPIPSGLFVCHHCDNRCCVRPDHLFLGTAADNIHDMYRKGRAVNVMGERIGVARLTRRQVPVIRLDYAAGKSQQAIADDLGVSQSAVSRVIRGVTWGHVGV